MVAGFEIIEYMFNNSFFINHETDPMNAIVLFAHEFSPLEIHQDINFDDS